MARRGHRDKGERRGRIKREASKRNTAPACACSRSRTLHILSSLPVAHPSETLRRQTSRGPLSLSDCNSIGGLWSSPFLGVSFLFWFPSVSVFLFATRLLLFLLLFHLGLGLFLCCAFSSGSCCLFTIALRFAF